MKQPQPSASPTPHPIPDSAVGAFRTAYAIHDPKKGYADAIRAGLAAAAPLVSHEATLSMEQATMERIRAEISSLLSYSSGYYVRVDAVLALLDRHASNREPNGGGNRLTAPAQSFQDDVANWMGQCFLPSLSSNMTERGDRLLEEVLELLQAHGYDSARVPTLVNYVFGRPVGEPAQEVGGVMVTLAAYCSVAGLSMQADGQAELDRINQPEVMARIRAKQEAKSALHFDTPLPGGAGAAAEEWPREGDLVRYGDGSSALAIRLGPHAGGWHGYQCCGGYTFFTKAYKPTRADMDIWLDCAKYRDERTKVADNRVAQEMYLIDNEVVGNG